MAQRVQVDTAVSPGWADALPGGHALQLASDHAAVSADHVPAGHSVHAREPFSRRDPKRPGPQPEHDDASFDPGGDAVPGGHCEQTT